MLVDLYEGMITDIPRYIGVDGLHPTEAGYERMAELIFGAIRKEFELEVAVGRIAIDLHLVCGPK